MKGDKFEVEVFSYVKFFHNHLEYSHPHAIAEQGRQLQHAESVNNVA